MNAQPSPIPLMAPYKGIQTLTASSYKTWSILLQHHLVAKGVFHQALAEPPPAAPPEPFAAWSASNARCMAVALKTVDPPHFTLCADFVHFRTMWQFLHNKYAVPNTQATEAYARQLETLTLLPHESISDYFMRIRLLATKLASAAEPVPDHHLVRYALQGLPPTTYDRMRSIIAHTPNVTLDTAEDMLLRDATIFPTTTPLMPLSDAFNMIRRNLPSTTAHQSQTRRQFEDTLYCSYHGTGTHSSAQCRALASQRSQNNTTYTRPNSRASRGNYRGSRRGRRNYFRPPPTPQASASFLEDEPSVFPEDQTPPPNDAVVHSALAMTTDSSPFLCLGATMQQEFHPYALVTQDPSTEIDNNTSWALDSGANIHLCMHYHWLLEPTPVNVQVRLAGKGHLLTATHVGKVRILLGTTKVQLCTVYYSSELAGNLLSVRDLASKDVLSLFDVNHVIAMSRDGETLATIPYTHGRYCLTAPALEHNNLPPPNHIPHTAGNATASIPIEPPVTTEPQQDAAMTTPTMTQTETPHKVKRTISPKNWELLHRRLGHISERKMRQLVRFGLLRHLNLAPTSLQHCEICACAKAKRRPFPGRHLIRAARPLHSLSIDIMGAISTPSLQGSKYALVIVDNYSRRYFVYGLQFRSQAPLYIAAFILERETELGVPVVSITTDNALEFNSYDFDNFLRTRGIRHQLTAPRTPTENAVAERAVGVLTEMTRCLLLESSLPPEFWEFALKFATYVHNITPCKSLPKNSSPMIRWNGQIPSYQHHRTFGSLCFVHGTKPNNRFKFQPTANPAIFLGYATRRGGYIVWPLHAKNITISRHVTFDEEKRVSFNDNSQQIKPTCSVLHQHPDSDSSSSSSDSDPFFPGDDPDDPPHSPADSDNEVLPDVSAEDAIPAPPSPNEHCERARTLRSWNARQHAET